jgi:hypothetical protein
MFEDTINGYKCSVVFDNAGKWVAETKLMPHADRLYHGPFDTREMAEQFIREHVPNWPPGHF